MGTAVTITLIICLTLVAICMMAFYSNVAERKEIMKKIDKFDKAFGKNKDNDDDLPKFGGF